MPMRGVSYRVEQGETLAVLGESGSGKSVSASAVMDILDSPPGYITSGEVLFEGRDLLPHDRGRAPRRSMASKIGMIFQDTLAHLNPVYPSAGRSPKTLRAHQGMDATVAPMPRRVRLLDRVGIPDRSRAAPAPTRTSSPAASGSG